MIKRKKLTVIGLVIALTIGLLTTNLFAQNRQEYNMNKAQCAYYVKLSREMVEKDNLPLARVYAQKAIQANSWDKAAWANYNDIIQKIADNGDVEDFETFIENSAAADVPKAGGANKFEGC